MAPAAETSHDASICFASARNCETADRSTIKSVWADIGVSAAQVAGETAVTVEAAIRECADGSYQLSILESARDRGLAGDRLKRHIALAADGVHAGARVAEAAGQCNIERFARKPARFTNSWLAADGERRHACSQPPAEP
jgi:hypothetical protein